MTEEQQGVFCSSLPTHVAIILGGSCDPGINFVRIRYEFWKSVIWVILLFQ